MSCSRPRPAEAPHLERRRRGPAAPAGASADRRASSPARSSSRPPRASLRVPAGKVATLRPLRNTEQSSASSAISPMRCEMKTSARPSRPQFLQHAEHRRDVARRQRRGGLVEDEEARLPAPAPWRSRRAGGATAAGRARATSGWMPSAPARASSSSARRRWRAPVDQAEAARRVGDQDVVGHRQVRDQRQFLEHADDAGRIGGGGVGEAHRRAVERHGAGVGLHDAGHALDQARLAGAVLAQHGVDAPRPHRQVDAVERPGGAVALGDARQGEEGGVQPAPLTLARDQPDRISAEPVTTGWPRTVP